MHPLIIAYHGRTGSRQAELILKNWGEVRRGRRLRKVVPLAVARKAEDFIAAGTNAGVTAAGACGAAAPRVMLGEGGEAMRYKVTLHRSEDGISVSVPALPGCCWSEGDTEAEALENIRDAIREHLAALADRSAAAEMREVEVEA